MLRENYSSTELIEILESLLDLDPKQNSGLELLIAVVPAAMRQIHLIFNNNCNHCSPNGIKICKNGGRSSTSKTGSVDVLEELGLGFEQNLETKLIALKILDLLFIIVKLSQRP